MTPLLFTVLLAAPLPAKPPGLATLTGLAGCWRVSGRVQDKPAPSVARGSWHLGGRYFTLQLRTVAGEPYEAAITYGAGAAPDQIGSIWHDTFGGLYEPSLGLGARTPTGFVQTYRFTDAVYANRFEHDGPGWHWTITEQAAGKPDKLFADYRLRPARCRGMSFSF